VCLVLESLDRTLQQFIIIIVKINKDKLKEKIKQGKSSHDIAMSYDVHPSTVRRKAKELGLKFETQTWWRKK